MVKGVGKFCPVFMGLIIKPDNLALSPLLHQASEGGGNLLLKDGPINILLHLKL